MKERKIIMTAAIVAIILILLGTYIATSSPQPNETEYRMDVLHSGDQKTLKVSSNNDTFLESISSADTYVYFILIDPYVDEDGVLDLEKFNEDLAKEDVFDEELQEYLPAIATKIVDENVYFTDAKNMSISFFKEGRYAAYILFVDGKAVIGGNAVGLSLFDLPDSQYKDVSPKISITSEIYENSEDVEITVVAENTEFSPYIKKDYVCLSGGISNLDVESVSVSDGILTIKTSGYVTRSSSMTGYVYLEPEATTSGLELAASVEILNNYMSVDPTSFKLEDSVFSFNLFIAKSIAEKCTTISYMDEELQIKDAIIGEKDGIFILGIEIPVDYDTYLSMLVDELSGSMLTAWGDDFSCDYYIYAAYPEIIATVEEVEKSGNDMIFIIALDAIHGTIKELNNDNVTFVSDYDSTTCDIKKTDEGYKATVTVKNLADDFFYGYFIIDGGVMTMWDVPADTLIAQITSVLVQSNPSTDEMIKAIYAGGQFSKVFSGISAAMMGIELVVNILGATGVIDMSTATDIKVNEINIKCDEIKKMLANQSEQLKDIKSKLCDIEQKIDELKTLGLSAIYQSMVDKSNTLSNLINQYSSKIKRDVWDMVQGQYDGKTMYFYVTTEGKLSVMQGSFFEKYTTGDTIDGKKILPEYTLGVSIVKDKTFAKAKVGTGFVTKETEKNVVSCLKEYYESTVGKSYSVPLPDGTTKTFTSSELAQSSYNCIVVKFTQQEARGDVGQKILDAYYAYTESLGSLVVLPDGTIIINTETGSNPTLASQTIVKSFFNFESEAHDYLKCMNDLNTLCLYNYTLTVSNIQMLMGEDNKNVQNHFDKCMEFLKGHRGYKTDASKVTDEYCYVTNTLISGTEIDIDISAQYNSSDDFKHNVKNVEIKKGLQTAAQLGMPSKILNTDQMEKLLKRYNMIKAAGLTKQSVIEYVGKHARNVGFNTQNLITSFGGGTTYGDGDRVVLYSSMNLVNPGHSAQLMDSGSRYTIAGTMDTSGFLHQFKAYSSEVYYKYAYIGKLYNLQKEQFYDNVANNQNYIFACGFFCKHVGAWTNDETAVLTSETFLDRCYTYQLRGENWWTIGIKCDYAVIGLKDLKENW